MLLWRFDDAGAILRRPASPAIDRRRRFSDESKVVKGI
jgi:hypothetical protein